MRLMEEEKKLYPLRFAPVAVEHAWGTEVYQLADLGVIDSEMFRFGRSTIRYGYYKRCKETFRRCCQSIKRYLYNQ